MNLCTIDAPTIIISFSFLFIIIISGRIGRAFSPSPFFFVLHNFQYIYGKQLGIILAFVVAPLSLKRHTKHFEGIRRILSKRHTPILLNRQLLARVNFCDNVSFAISKICNGKLSGLLLGREL